MPNRHVGSAEAHDSRVWPQSGGHGEAKARKACINCRRQKMKCISDNGSKCRRCQRNDVACIYVPRANAAVLPGTSIDLANAGSFNDVLQRLKTIEEYLGFTRSQEPEQMDTGLASDESSDEAEPASSALAILWTALEPLKRLCPKPSGSNIWRRSTVKHLWSTFHEKMPGLHFMPDKQTFSSPHPLLLASILHCSSKRGEPDMAQMAPEYFEVLCTAIAQFAMPDSEIGRPPEDPAAAEEWAFQTVLGIVLAGLLTEASTRETGIWISIAYRLILEHCPRQDDTRSGGWRRSLPTIWSCFKSDLPEMGNSTIPFTAVDGAIIRDWARQLDDWLAEFTKALQDTEQDRGTTPKERHELLLSARAALKLHLNDSTIWSNWDLVMITWAALIVIQGLEGGAGEPDDLNDINTHVKMLRQTNEPKPSLRDKLATRLERSLESIHIPSPSAIQASMESTSPVISYPNYPWNIFDQTSLQQVEYPMWLPDSSQMQPAQS
ncbi:hypothetical protein JX265_010504 [Neoarthrinium moseri]|uniref:Zn(2)-C6 fungal-type domain-containing protein n=1 Tax=Neoarthrinium moseri TaxID=1658444 RepID=A0A9P9WE23_9PEZI|nr:uncharacterized protein JN550_004041 [Neoarthrinium moseri]KAI1846127.1 hypothetical protein JX266_007652 [Neoarthrinium moseri]KAI1859027.1 hypothetical protein JX265_010504 [Neoarthrinium moseri]KAI1872322.1 hypothetical protein JN550_004041 [Neoarthrinium moseri]